MTIVSTEIKNREEALTKNAEDIRQAIVEFEDSINKNEDTSWFYQEVLESLKIRKKIFRDLTSMFKDLYEAGNETAGNRLVQVYRLDSSLDIYDRFLQYQKDVHPMDDIEVLKLIRTLAKEERI